MNFFSQINDTNFVKHFYDLVFDTPCLAVHYFPKIN